MIPLTPEQLAKIRMLKKISMAQKPDLSTIAGPAFGNYGRTKSSQPG
jgi:hypothetical protein